MKKIVIESDSEVVSLSSITASSFVGIQWVETNGCKSFVVRSETGNFYGVSGDDLTSVRAPWTKPSLKEYIERTIKGQGAVAYVFEDYKELFKWLIE